MKRKKGISDFGGVLEWCESWQWGEIWIPVGVSHLRAEPAGSIKVPGWLNSPCWNGLFISFTKQAAGHLWPCLSRVQRK